MNGIEAIKEAGDGGVVASPDGVEWEVRGGETRYTGGSPKYWQTVQLTQGGWRIVRLGPAKPAEPEPYKTPFMLNADGRYADFNGRALRSDDNGSVVARLNATVEAAKEQGKAESAEMIAMRNSELASYERALLVADARIANLERELAECRNSGTPFNTAELVLLEAAKGRSKTGPLQLDDVDGLGGVLSDAMKAYYASTEMSPPPETKPAEPAAGESSCTTEQAEAIRDAEKAPMKTGEPPVSTPLSEAEKTVLRAVRSRCTFHNTNEPAVPVEGDWVIGVFLADAMNAYMTLVRKAAKTAKAVGDKCEICGKDKHPSLACGENSGPQP